MKRLSIIVLLAILASTMFSSQVVAGYPLAQQPGACGGLMNAITQVPPGSPAFKAKLTQAAKLNCSTVLDRGALLALYYSAGGENWEYQAGWLTEPDHCNWLRVSCSEGRVTSLSLSFDNLVGSIPPELGYLTSLTNLNLVYNKLRGPIPPELGKLTSLTNLNLYHNMLSGPIPPELGNLTNLKELNLFRNQLSGPIPPELGKLTNLTFLTLSINQLIGPIPPELGNLTNLTRLALNRNKLSDSIPPSWETFSTWKVLTLPIIS